MTVINLKGLQLSYQVRPGHREVPVVFIHGNSHNQKSFSKQLESPALKDYTLISLDLPGHGDSQNLSSYSAVSLSETLNDFLIQLEIKNAILVGHSLGGHLIMHLLKKFSPKGILFYGAPPLKKPLDMSGFKDCPESEALFKENVTAQERHDLISCLYENPDCDPYIDKSFQQTDPSFRSGILNSLSHSEYYDEVKLLNSYQGPKAILSASKDKLINNSYLEQNIDQNQLWQQRIIRVPTSHNIHREASDEFNQILLSFLNHVTFS